MSLPRTLLEKLIIPGCVFVETGTRWGDTAIRAIEAGASCAITIESDELFATLAKMHIRDALRENSEKVRVLVGPSTACLQGLAVPGFFDGSPRLIFLDAHTDTHTPVLEELAIIATWKPLPYCILIDDLRLFGTSWQGCTKENLLCRVRELFPGAEIAYADGTVPGDILVLRPRQ